MSTTDERVPVEDELGFLARARDVVASSLDLRPLEVPDRVAHARREATSETEAGGIDLWSFDAPQLERFTTYRFHRRQVLNEHLVHGWPAQGYDFPALTLVIFETAHGLIVGADLLPVLDVVFDCDYYGRYMLGYAQLLEEHWPTLVAHRLGPEPAPDPYFTNQVGSTTSVLLHLGHGALRAALDFELAVTREWAGIAAEAVEATGPRRDRAVARREQLIRIGYKGLDYHSPASDGLASVLGWRGANTVFDCVFGPDTPPKPLNERRRYLDFDVSPGTPPIKSSP